MAEAVRQPLRPFFIGQAHVADATESARFVSVLFRMGLAQMYDARAVANVLLQFAANEGIALSNLKLQKLLYLAHGRLLTSEGRPLVKGGFEAWAYGPVSRTAYHAFKQYESMAINGPALRFDPVKRTYENIDVEIDQSAVFAIEEVVQKFGRWPEFDLVEFTHKPGTPWRQTMDNAELSANVGMIIDDDLIRREFEAKNEFELENG